LSNPDAGAGFRARPGLLPTILYSKLDARGHARRVQDGQHDLAFTYDAAERLTQVAQADASGNPDTPVVTAFSYSTANGASNWKKGKLETTTAYNPDLTGASVVETYTYGGVAGRVSARQTQVEGRTINQSFAWTDLGPIGTLGYPEDTVLADPARPVSYGYSLGYLTSVGSVLTRGTGAKAAAAKTRSGAARRRIDRAGDAGDPLLAPGLVARRLLRRTAGNHRQRPRTFRSFAVG